MQKQLRLISWISLTISLLSSTTNAQEIVFERRINLVTHGAVKDKLSDVIPVITNDQLDALIFLEKEGISIVELEDDLTEKSFYVNQRPLEYQSQDAIGYSVEDGTYFLFNANASRTKFYIHRVSPEKQINDTQAAPISLRNERILETLSSNGLFYLLTVVKKSSELRVYEFQGAKLKRTQAFDFSNMNFPDGHNHKDLYRALLELDGMRQSLVINKIELNDPVSLEQAAKQSKLYIDGNKLYFTFDYAIRSTTVLQIDLEDFSSAAETYEHASSACPRSQYFQTNSFVNNNRLYQMQLCKSLLSFQVVDLATDATVASFSSEEGQNDWILGSVLEDNEAEFAPSEDLEMRSAKEALKSIAKNDAAVVVRTNSEKLLELKVGGHLKAYKTSYNETVNHSTMGVGPNGSIPMNYTFSTYSNYRRYENSKATYFEALLSEDTFEPTDGEIYENVFDKIRYFKANEYDEKGKSGGIFNSNARSGDTLPVLKNETLFRLNEQYYFGYFVEGKSSFILHSFEK